MNIKAIIASLVLGSSSVAMADPGVTFSAEAEGTFGPPTVRDHRYEREPVTQDRNRYEAPTPLRDRSDRRGGWAGRDVISPAYRRAVLASDLSFGRDGRELIPVGPDLGRFRSLGVHRGW